MTGLPYYPFYPSDFEGKTSHLTLEEDGAYNRLLRLMWMTPGCSLPNDDAWLARRMRVDAATFERVVKPLIGEFCKVVGGRIINARLREEHEKADETYRRRSEAGKKGGRPKAIDNKGNETKAGLSREKAGPKQPEPEPDLEVREKEEPKGSSKKSASRAKQVPSDFQPSPAGMDYAVSKGMPASQIPAQVEKFILHHQSKGSTFKDVGRAWQTWCANYAGFRASTPSNVVPIPKPSPVDVRQYHPHAIDMGGGWWTTPGDEVEWYKNTNEMRPNKWIRDRQAAEERAWLSGAING